MWEPFGAVVSQSIPVRGGSIGAEAPEAVSPFAATANRILCTTTAMELATMPTSSPVFFALMAHLSVR
jgi:hypothetical protein